MNADVIIAGGGVAGSTLAVMLGRAGLSVELYERHVLPHDKACAEGIMPAGVGVLSRLGLLDVVGGQPFHGVRHSGFGRQIASAFPRADGVPPTGVGQRRLHLDRALIDAARATPGVRVFEGAAVEGALLQSGRVHGVRVGGVERRARLTVAADGPRSPLRRSLGLQARVRGRPRLGVRAHFRLAVGAPALQLVEVFVADGRELYLTPLPNREVVVAALVPLQANEGQIDRRFETWREQTPRLREILCGAQQISELAGRSPLHTAARAGTLPGLALVGDAAGSTDPVTGGGIAQALLSAEALALRLTAGRLLRAGFDAGDDRLTAFDRERKTMLRDGRVLTAFLLGLLHRPRAAGAVMRLMDAWPPLHQHLLGVAGNAGRLVPL